MPYPTISMQKIRDILRYYYGDNLSKRKIAQYLLVSPGTVRNYLCRAERAGLGWPLPEGLTDEVLEEMLFPFPKSSRRAQPDWPKIHKKLSRKGVTLERVWTEYVHAHPDGYSYGHFCELYKQWSGMQNVTMHLDHKAGEKLFVDFAGTSVGFLDAVTGDVANAQIFVATLGYSHYTYVEAVKDQKLTSWIGVHERTLEFFGAVPQVIVCDNLKSAVTRSHRTNPELNQTYRDFSLHYGCKIFPARPYRPQDKSIVELAVKFVTNRILSSLGSRDLFGLEDVNQAIEPMLEELNRLPFQKRPGTRRSQFEELELPAMSALPPDRFAYREWKQLKVRADYHAPVNGKRYSVPCRYAHKRLEACIFEKSIQFFYQNKLIATHLRLGKHETRSTRQEHMPEGHRRYRDQKALLEKARAMGPKVGKLAEILLLNQELPEQNYRTLMGIIGLGKCYPLPRVDAACGLALSLGEEALRYSCIASILQYKRDVDWDKPQSIPQVVHENIRGGDYYANKPTRFR